MSPFMVIVSFSVYAAAGVAPGTISGGLFGSRIGQRNTGGILAGFNVKSSTQCAVTCVQHRSCNSFNVGPACGTSRSCELVRMDTDSLATITAEAGWTFMPSKI